jgi:hypothetical protein
LVPSQVCREIDKKREKKGDQESRQEGHKRKGI